MSETSHKLHTTFQHSSPSFFPQNPISTKFNQIQTLFAIFSIRSLYHLLLCSYIQPSIHPSFIDQLEAQQRKPTISFYSSLSAVPCNRGRSVAFTLLHSSRRYTTLVSIIHLRSNDCCSSHCKSLSFFFPSPILTFSLPPSLPHLTTYLPAIDHRPIETTRRVQRQILYSSYYITIITIRHRRRCCHPLYVVLCKLCISSSRKQLAAMHTNSSLP